MQAFTLLMAVLQNAFAPLFAPPEHWQQDRGTAQVQAHVFGS